MAWASFIPAILSGINAVGNFFKSDAGASLGGSAMNAIAGVVSSKQQMKYAKELQNQSFGFNKELAKLGYGYNTKLQKQSMDLSKQLQAYQNAYTTKMASSAHQIEVNDLRKAGLNPILSATGGNGASFSTGGATVGNASVGTGSVGAGSVGAPDYGDFTTALSQYLNIKQTKKDIALAEAQGRNLDKDTNYKEYLSQTEKERAENTREERKSIIQTRKNEMAKTAAEIDYMAKQGQASIINAGANVSSAKAANDANIQRERVRLDERGSNPWKTFHNYVYVPWKEGLDQAKRRVGWR